MPWVFLLALGAWAAAAEPAPMPSVQAQAPIPAAAAAGRVLYLKNCAHCHADDATGDEGPDLHGLKKSDEWLSKRIRNGIKGEMPAFGEKFAERDISALIAYLRTLEGKAN